MEPQKICSDLVGIKSENPLGDTSEVIEYIRDFLDARGIESLVTRNEGGRCNLVTTGEPRPLLLCGHVDVVPALNEGWIYPPFSGAIQDGYVWGRGASDMKGGCSAILSACDALVEEGETLPATLAFVCDEEPGEIAGSGTCLQKNCSLPATACLPNRALPCTRVSARRGSAGWN